MLKYMYIYSFSDGMERKLFFMKNKKKRVEEPRSTCYIRTQNQHRKSVIKRGCDQIINKEVEILKAYNEI